MFHGGHEVRQRVHGREQPCDEFRWKEAGVSSAHLDSIRFLVSPVGLEPTAPRLKVIRISNDFNVNSPHTGDSSITANLYRMAAGRRHPARPPATTWLRSRRLAPLVLDAGRLVEEHGEELAHLGWIAKQLFGPSAHASSARMECGLCSPLPSRRSGEHHDARHPYPLPDRQGARVQKGVRCGLKRGLLWLPKIGIKTIERTAAAGSNPGQETTDS
jgi:hypothetical protein